jgi:hypothetical protein
MFFNVFLFHIILYLGIMISFGGCSTVMYSPSIRGPDSQPHLIQPPFLQKELYKNSKKT